MKKRIIIISSIIVVLVLVSFVFYMNRNKKEIDHSTDYLNSRENVSYYLNNIDLDNVDNLMIVTHPDDDIIWGGSHLLDDNYLVICVTCGVVQKRVDEFKSVMNKTDDEYIMLGYPDLTNGKRDNWDTSYDKIKTDLKKIIDYKDWNIVVTHNPEGEYGHKQHIMTNEIVTSIAPKNKLMYFGKYYKKDEVPTDLDEISEKNYKTKIDVLAPLYASQKIIEPFGQMLNHEKWVSYSNWSKNNND